MARRKHRNNLKELCKGRGVPSHLKHGSNPTPHKGSKTTRKEDMVSRFNLTAQHTKPISWTKSEVVFKSSFRSTLIYSCCREHPCLAVPGLTAYVLGNWSVYHTWYNIWMLRKGPGYSVTNAPWSKPQTVTWRCVEWRRWRLRPTRFDCGEGILRAPAASTDEASGMEEAIPLTLRPASTVWWRIELKVAL
jgi:hypothetical protein